MILLSQFSPKIWHSARKIKIVAYSKKGQPFEKLGSLCSAYWITLFGTPDRTCTNNADIIWGNFGPLPLIWSRGLYTAPLQINPCMLYIRSIGWFIQKMISDFVWHAIWKVKPCPSCFIEWFLGTLIGVIHKPCWQFFLDIFDPPPLCRPFH